MWGHSGFIRTHKAAQHSLPSNNFTYTPATSSSPNMVSQIDSQANSHRFERSSADFTYTNFAENMNKMSQPESGHSRQASMPKLQSSFSTSDLPTIRNATGPQNNYNRGPLVGQRHSRELSIGTVERNIAVSDSLHDIWFIS